METWAAIWALRRGRPVLFAVLDDPTRALELAVLLHRLFGLQLFIGAAPWAERPLCAAARLAPAPDARAPLRVGLERRKVANSHLRAGRGRRADDLSLVRPLEPIASRARVLASVRGVPVRMSYPSGRSPRAIANTARERKRL